MGIFSHFDCVTEQVRSITGLVAAASLVVAPSLIGPGIGPGIGFESGWAVHADDGPATEARAMAAYADAANFQNGGALDLAIEAWGDFLRQYPEHEKASEAAHFLGVCHMQTDPPDLVAASDAFDRALRGDAHQLREESLANYGWCLYARGGDGDSTDPAALRRSARVFKQLLDEFPESMFADRALFYLGEVAYRDGDAATAVDRYNQLLTSSLAERSPLRCDALYARGIAFEELGRPDAAAKSYRQMLASCDRRALITDVHLRLGDLSIADEQFDAALDSFDKVLASSEVEPDDAAYALYRSGFALARAGRPAEAAAKYRRLIEEYADSTLAEASRLASAQSYFQAGEMDAAADAFEAVLDGPSVAAPVRREAAHWLSRIYLSRGETGRVIALVRENLPAEANALPAEANALPAGTNRGFVADLKFDLAEALAVDPTTREEALPLFVSAYREAGGSDLAPRALYNAAFTALQLGSVEQSLELADEFLRAHADHPLAGDVKFIRGESLLMRGQTDRAADAYADLIRNADRDTVQFPAWLSRAAFVHNKARRFADTIELLDAHIEQVEAPEQLADVNLLLGRAYLATGNLDGADQAFRDAGRVSPPGAVADRVALAAASAWLSADERERATPLLVDLAAGDSTLADQAAFRLGNLAADAGEYSSAIERFESVVAGESAKLTPFALHALAYAEMRSERYETALATLDRLADEFPDHPIQTQARLTRGMTLRNLGRLDLAGNEIDRYLRSNPTGMNLGNALYESALLAQARSEPADAVASLGRIIDEVPDFPDMDKVIYELGWSLQESGRESQANDRFAELLRRFPGTELAAEAAFFLGQKRYAAGEFSAAIGQFEIAADTTGDSKLAEKALYRLGWSTFKDEQYDASRAAFARLAREHPDGRLAFDARMMIGESNFRIADYAAALDAFSLTRQQIVEADDDSESVRQPADRQVRELALLHGGQSAAQLRRWREAIEWYDELRQRFPETRYLPQVFYETGFANQRLGNDDEALKFYGEVANNFRDAVAARARFMMGEIHFARSDFAEAISEFQRVMFGFGADRAPADVRTWQAKSGLEAGRCGERLIDLAATEEGRQKARDLAMKFYRYVTDKHPAETLADTARRRLEALAK